MIEYFEQGDFYPLHELTLAILITATNLGSLLILQQVEQRSQQILLDHSQQKMTMQLIWAYIFRPDLQQITDQQNNKLHHLYVCFLSFLYWGFDVIGDVEDQICYSLVFGECFLVFLESFG